MSVNKRRLGCETASIETHTHRGHPVPVGEFTIYAGGAMYLEPEEIAKFDIVVALTELHNPEQLKQNLKPGAELVEYSLPDFGGVPDDWHQFVDRVVQMLAEGKKVLAFCGAGQGRTGTLLASLVALVEYEVLNPIEAVRERYCPHAVETIEQAKAVFALRAEFFYGGGRMVPPGIWDGEKFSMARTEQ